MTPRPAPPDVRRLGFVQSFVVFVRSTPDAPLVRVRYRRSTGSAAWRCDRCGSHRTPSCAHEQAAHFLTTTQQETP